MSPQEAWEHYYEEQKTDGATFKKLLKSTFQKPRDILTFIKISRELRIKSGNGKDTHFPYDSLSSPILTRKFSDYLLGETRNYSAFYMTPTDFQNYIKFFQYLNGQPRFSYREFEIAFEKFSQWAKGESIKAQEFLRDAESLLQFFYDVNIIGYSEQTEGRGEIYHHWSYRERSLNDIAPKVKSNSRLIINPGISKSLDIGKSFKLESTNNQSRPSRSPKITRNKKHGQPITHNKS